MKHGRRVWKIISKQSHLRAFPPRVCRLDFLRALAIFFVLVAHGTGLLMLFVPWWFGFFSHGGFYGVE
jgi:hypothetical protein